MSSTLPVGPYRTVTTASGLSIPFYIIPFDKDGVCTGTLTRDHLIHALTRGDYTDVFFFSHGWNNDWQAATERYEHFLQGYLDLAAERARIEPSGREIRPVLVGVFWPSTAFVWPWEDAPDIAAAGDAESDTDFDARIGEDFAELQELALLVPDADRARFYALAQQESVEGEDAVAFAAMLLPVFDATDDDLPPEAAGAEEITAASLVRSLAPTASTTARDLDTSGEIRSIEEFTGIDDGPEAAGIFDTLDPRKVLRMATVRQMKDRAGQVGSRGAGELLRDILEHSTAHVHLIGHSYGCRVVLSALCSQKPPRPVRSVLLLQPAISHLCFAADVEGTGKPGGYRDALDEAWAERPILATFTRHDFALRQIFHKVFWRDRDLAEFEIAADGPPSRWAALGGYGPGGCSGDCISFEMLASGTPYNLKTLGPDIRVAGLDGADWIKGHGDISVAATWWALYQQVNA